MFITQIALIRSWRNSPPSVRSVKRAHSQSTWMPFPFTWQEKADTIWSTFRGYIPIKLTNAVVRRERILRRSRGRAVAQGLNNNNLNNDGGETGTNIPLQPIATPLAAALAPTGSRRDRLRIPRLGMNRQTVSEEEEAERIRTSKCMFLCIPLVSRQYMLTRALLIVVCNTSQSHIKENLF